MIATFEKISSINPATMEVIGEVDITPPEDIPGIVERARKAQKSWWEIGFARRADYLFKAQQYLLAHASDVATLISKETGKPRMEAFSTEVFPMIDTLALYAKHGESMLRRESIRLHNPMFLNKKSYIDYQPRGVVAIVSPWNYPFSIPFHLVAAALISGNTMLLKTSSETPFTGLKIGEIFQAVGLPEGVLNVVSGPGRTTGQAVIEAKVNKIFFVGSVEIGRRVMETAARNLITVNLELGGKDPMIVLEDTNLERAVNGAIWGAFTNAGQTCAAVERVYVHQSLYDKFVEQVAEKTRKLRVGPDTDYNVDMGSMTTESQLRVCEYQVKDAVEKGARVLTGGKRLDRPGLFFPPTVLVDVNHTMACMMEETFGPLLPIMPYRTVEEALELANDSTFGLTASVWSRNTSRARDIADRIEAGTVTINDHIFTHGAGETPWGGLKDSGTGRSHGRIGLLEFVEPHHINYELLNLPANVWWYPYGKGIYDRLLESVHVLFNQDWRAKMGNLPGMAKLLPRMLGRG